MSMRRENADADGDRFAFKSPPRARVSISVAKASSGDSTENPLGCLVTAELFLDTNEPRGKVFPRNEFLSVGAEAAH